MFDIKVNPSDGDVWIATSHGIARYRASLEGLNALEQGKKKQVKSVKSSATVKSNQFNPERNLPEKSPGNKIISDTKTALPVTRNLWTYYTRLNGLPSDQISSIAFSKNGKFVYIGTQCEGIAIGRIRNNTDEIKWRTVNGPVRMPLSHVGEGLPSGRINELAVGPDGKIYAATDCGLAIGDKVGAKWVFHRGRDLLKKAEMLFIPMHIKSKFIRDEREKILKKRASVLKLQPSDFKFEEDFISSIQIDPDGKLWLGQREKGYCVYDPKKGKVVHSTQDDLDLWGLEEILVSRVLFPFNGATLVALYGKGLLQSGQKIKKKSKPLLKAKTVIKSKDGYIKHPFPAKAPTEEELYVMIADVCKEKDLFQVGHAAYLGEDWKTNGDWVGRYGRQYAVLAAVCAPFNVYPCLTRTKTYWVKEMMGVHKKDADSILKRYT